MTIAALRPGSLAGVPAWAALYLLYYCPAFRVLEFLIGCMVGRLFMLPTGTNPALATRSLIPSVLLVAASLLVGHALSPVPQLLSALYALPFAIFIYVLARSGPSWIAHLLAGKVLVTLGEWAFAFYMLHWLVLRCYAMLGLPPGRMVAVPVTFTTSLVLAALCYRWIEAPFRKWIRQGATRRSASRDGKGRWA